MKCAIATVAIGQNHQSAYAAIFRPSVERYVARHGYDLVVFDDYLADPQATGAPVVNFEPLRVPFHERVYGYDRVMVLDVDVLISAKAPPFHTLDLGTKIGVVDEWCQPSREERHKFQLINGLVPTAREYHALGGFAIDSERVINGGMFICVPRVHGVLFRHLVAQHIETQRVSTWGTQFEQAMLSFELQTRDLGQFLPTLWNCLWPHHRRTAKWGAPTATTGARERWDDLKRFREVLDANFVLHMTGGLDHDLAFVSRNR
jgi:hypothetical protein